MNEQAVLVYLDGSGLAPEVYEAYHLDTLEDQLIAAIERANAGEFDGIERAVPGPSDGDERGPGDVALYMYGPDAEILFRAVEPVLRSHPLCSGARVIIRAGGPEVDGREVRLPRSSAQPD